MRDPGGEKHELGGLVARIVGAVPKVHAGAAERARAAVDGGADGLGCRMG